MIVNRDVDKYRSAEQRASCNVLFLFFKSENGQ